MKEKITEIFRSILSFILFWGIVIFAGYIALSQDPDINWIMRLVGFIATVYFLVRKLYPENWKKAETAANLTEDEKENIRILGRKTLVEKEE